MMRTTAGGTRSRRARWAFLAVMTFLAVACAIQQRPGTGELHRWWAGFGPVIPHDNFPAECTLCHSGAKWNTLRQDFKFDHEKRTGVKLTGAHAQAKCLRCHNDRGPVSAFAAKGCLGCHEDSHYGELGRDCKSCHTEDTWRPHGQIERHNRTRFPLTGAHLAVSCFRCHPGARVGNFLPTDTECVGCHSDDRDATNNPPHVPLGWVDNCHRCHMPTRWNQTR